MRLYPRSQIRNWAKRRFPTLYEKRLGIALILLSAFVLLILFKDVVQMLIIMLMLSLMGIGSMMYNRFIKISLGVELIMLATVITGFLYGVVPALIVGVISLFIAEVLIDAFQYKTFVSFIGMFAVALSLPLVSDMSITWAGVLLTILYDAIIIPGYILLGSEIWKSLLFMATHIIFNVWVFVYIAPRLFQILS